jgi:hypothetical protein
MAWVSVSIDLCGSTLVKQTLVELTADDPARRRSLYAEYLKVLYNTEREFYTLLLDNPEFDFSKLVLIKIIGDEFWYCCEIDEDDKTRFIATATALIDALMELCARDRDLQLAPEDDAGPVNGKVRRRSPVKQFDLPIKVCVDLLHEPIEMTAARYEFLKDIVSLADGDHSTVYKVDKAFARRCDRLNLGSPDFFDEGRRVTTRTDYIGLEIDRFFRLTRLCLPRLVSIGETLIAALPLSIHPAAAGLEHIDTKIADFAAGGTRPAGSALQRKYMISQTVPSAMMKGISGDYAIHHLFGSASLGESAFSPPADVETLMGPTRAFLAEHGFFALDRNHLLP